MPRRSFSLAHSNTQFESLLQERQDVLGSFGASGSNTVAKCKEFIINKRDSPLLSLCDSDERTSAIPVLSQYISEDFEDLPFPPVADYTRALAGGYTGEKYVPPLELSVPAWHNRKSAAIFRGSATGRGVCQDVNMRLRVCALSKLWYCMNRHNPPLLDARLTSWNPRHKWSTCGSFEVVDPSLAALPLTPRSGASKSNHMTMAQQGHWKYYVLIDGNVGASRLGELAQRCFLVLWVRSKLPQVAYANDQLVAWRYFVPVASNLIDLEEKLLWCREHDDAVRWMAENMRDALSPMLTRASLEASLAHTLHTLPPPMPQDSFRNIMLWLWQKRRSGVYVLLDPDGILLLFRPFANKDFHNDWAEAIPNRVVHAFLRRARALWPNDRSLIIPDVRRWWTNGCLICNVMPPGIWSESMLPEIHALLVGAGNHLASVERRGAP